MIPASLAASLFSSISTYAVSHELLSRFHNDVVKLEITIRHCEIYSGSIVECEWGNLSCTTTVVKVTICITQYRLTTLIADVDMALSDAFTACITVCLFFN
jgi:hypothetical protein